MSGRAVGFVLDHYAAATAAARARKSVLVAIADGCTADGRHSTRSLPTIADRVGFNIGHVRRCVRVLESEGWLRGSPRRGDSTVYDVIPLAETTQGTFALPVDNYREPRAFSRVTPRILGGNPARLDARLTVVNGMNAATADNDAEASPSLAEIVVAWNPAVVPDGLARARAELTRSRKAATS